MEHVEDAEAEILNRLFINGGRNGWNYTKQLIQNDEVSRMKSLIKVRPEVVEMRGGIFKHTPLLYACRYGSVNMVRLLCESGSDVQVTVVDSARTVLHQAVSNRYHHVVVTKYLCELHPHLVQVEDKVGSTPLHTAASNNHTDVVPILLQCQPPAQLITKEDHVGVSPLSVAKEGNNETIVELFEQYRKQVIPKTGQKQQKTHFQPSAFKSPRQN